MKFHLVTVEKSWTETHPSGITVHIPAGITLAGQIVGDEFIFTIWIGNQNMMSCRQDFSEKRIIPVLEGLKLK